MTTKPYDSKMKGESEEMFFRFTIYRDLGVNRTYANAAKEYNRQRAEMAKNGTSHKEVTENAMRKTGIRWFHDERCALFDANKILEDARELDENFKEYNKKIISILEKLINFLETKLEEIIANTQEYALSTQLNLLYNYMNILDKAIYNYRLSSGRSTDNKELTHQGELNVSGELTSENTLKYSTEEMKQIQATSSEPDEEIQEFLDQL